MGEVVDFLILNGHLLTMAGDGVGYVANGAVAVRGSTIVAVGDALDLSLRFDARETVDASGCAVLPGLIDAHMHTPLAIVRGVSQDIHHWMQQGLAPYSRHISRYAALAGVRLNVLEAIKAGTTTLGDYATPHDGWADVFEEAGVRAVLTPTINALPAGGMAGWRVGELYPLDPAAGRTSTDMAMIFARNWNGAAEGRIHTMMGPQAADMLDREQLLEVKRFADREGLMIHMHVAQGDREIDQLLKRYGKRTPTFLEQIGYLDEQLLAVHLTEATDEEAALIATSGARMVLCSGSIGIIDGIVPPALAFRQAGGLVALGSDQAAGNNCNNIFNEMKLTALFNKIKYRDPTVMPAWDVLRMATIEGARALGMGDQIGSLEVGKQADLIGVNLRALNLMPTLTSPIRNIVPNLVYAATGKEVDLVMVAGRVLVRNGAVLTADEEAAREEAQLYAEEVASSVRRDPVHRDMALMDAMARGQL